jgi:hypothetical protein
VPLMVAYTCCCIRWTVSDVKPAPCQSMVKREDNDEGGALRASGFSVRSCPQRHPCVLLHSGMHSGHQVLSFNTKRGMFWVFCEHTLRPRQLMCLGRLWYLIPADHRLRERP